MKLFRNKKDIEYKTIKSGSMDFLERQWISEFEPAGWDVDKGMWVAWNNKYAIRFKRAYVRELCKEPECRRTREKDEVYKGRCFRHGVRTMFEFGGKIEQRLKK